MDEFHGLGLTTVGKDGPQKPTDSYRIQPSQTDVFAPKYSTSKV